MLAADDDMKVNVILAVQLWERQSTEREDGGSSLGQTNNQGLKKNTVKIMKVVILI